MAPGVASPVLPKEALKPVGTRGLVLAPAPRTFPFRRSRKIILRASPAAQRILLPLRSIPAERRRRPPLHFPFLGVGIHPSEFGTFLLSLATPWRIKWSFFMDPKSNAMPVDTLEEEVELKEGEDLPVKSKRTKFSVSTVQPQQGVEVSDMENKVHGVFLHKVSASKDPMNRFTDSAVQGTGTTNGCMKGHANGTFFTGNESARSRLLKFCRANGWKEPLYDTEEQGPPHNKLFSCKVTIHVDGISNTVLECFGGPKRQKKAAHEHAARGALWCLTHFGHVK